MSGYTDFVAMSGPEATEFLEGLLADQQRSLDQFSSSIGVDLTYAVESLIQVWEAIAPRLTWRADYLAPSPGQLGPRISVDQLEPPAELPVWFHHPSGVGYARFSSKTLWLIDGAGRYLGETVVRTGRGNWATGRSRAKGYIFQNQPVIALTEAAPVSPFQTAAVLASRTLGPSTDTGPKTLFDVYRAWCH
ncbi:hypothetical protein ACSBPH_13685 [Microbacterium sp. F51-2R]|uniref:hypothetical protein n=1 Tax=Microbacterium sp. F51-2R TaxID=3445777 RepID=UPI003FA06C40